MSSSNSQGGCSRSSGRDNCTKRPWVDPAALPSADYTMLAYPDAREIGGNAPSRVKQLALNTFASYGVGDAAAFGHAAGRKVRFVRIDVDGPRCSDSSAHGRKGDNRGGVHEGGDSVTSATAVAELVVDKSMVNGNEMMHGGCIAYLIDNCGSVPLVVLGLLRGKNGVGVTQALNILFHAPAPLGSTLEIISTSLALGGRSMTSKCEIFNKSSGRLVASAFLNKMEPKL